MGCLVNSIKSRTWELNFELWLLRFCFLVQSQIGSCSQQRNDGLQVVPCQCRALFKVYGSKISYTSTWVPLNRYFVLEWVEFLNLGVPSLKLCWYTKQINDTRCLSRSPASSTGSQPEHRHGHCALSHSPSIGCDFPIIYQSAFSFRCLGFHNDRLR